MDLRKAFSKRRRDELVHETAKFLGESYSFIAENALAGRLNDIAAGHLMNLAGREEIAGGLSEKALAEMDQLFFLMSLRALNIFTLDCQSMALARAVRGEEMGGLPMESVPELASLLEKRVKAIAKEEALQNKVFLAVAAGKPTGGLEPKLKKKQCEVRALAIEIEKASGLKRAIT